MEELPSDFPILLLGTCSLPLAELDTDHISVFPLHNVYVLPNLTPIYFLRNFGVLWFFAAFYMFFNNKKTIFLMEHCEIDLVHMLTIEIIHECLLPMRLIRLDILDSTV